MVGGKTWAGWNETCAKDAASGKYCGDILSGSMPIDRFCSPCNIDRFQKMQSTPYSEYDISFQSQLKNMNSKCGLNIPTDFPDFLQPRTNLNKPSGSCVSGIEYTTVEGDTCDSIATKYNVSSAALFIGHDNLLECEDIVVGTELCMPLQCEKVYTIKSRDTCNSIEKSQGIRYKELRKYNPWIDSYCSNLHTVSDVAYGHVVCLSPQAGISNEIATTSWMDPTSPPEADGYAIPERPPPQNATIAERTTTRCGRWHVVTNKIVQETCTTVCMQNQIYWSLFMEVNPSLSADNCDKLVSGTAYCVGPTYGWDEIFDLVEGEREEYS
ncbi:CAZyme family GH55 [Penicillium antarcticum]|nr:CAZyme family GH55 [Penicillium antarcticum]KAJ5317598.1 CAZyme family GH55 [Penicillium antarcticum]